MNIRSKPIPSPYYSKPQMKNKNYEIYYNKDDYVEKIRHHKHEYYEFYFLISGEVTYTIDNKNYNLKSGDTLLIAPNQYHHATINISGNQSYERYILWLNPTYLKSMSTSKTDLLLPFQTINCSSSYIQLTCDTQLIVMNLLQMILINSHSDEYGCDLLINSYIIELLVHIAKVKLFQQTLYFEKDFGNNHIVLSALNYITEHISEDIKVNDLTDHLYISRSYLSKLFTSTTGLTIHEYIIKKKLFLAKQELLAQTPLQDIYQKYAFGNYSSFYRSFKKEFGMSPRNFIKTELFSVVPSEQKQIK